MRGGDGGRGERARDRVIFPRRSKRFPAGGSRQALIGFNSQFPIP